MNLKIEGNSVGKIMYNGQEFGGATKLEPGTILHMSETGKTSLRSQHLLSTTKNWSNINGINVKMHNGDKFDKIHLDVNITGDDFKNLNKAKKYRETDNTVVTVSRSIVDGEYRLNISADNYIYIFEIGAL